MTSSKAAAAMYPNLVSKPDALRREQGSTPKGVSAAECVYGRREPERRFYNPLYRVVKPATKRR
jgi:hypothetical protein